MKLLMIATALLVLSGCERAAEVEQQSRLEEQQVSEPAEFTVREIRVEGAAPNFYILTDEVTGCQYLAKYGSNGPVTPRLNHLGKPICNDKAVTP